MNGKSSESFAERRGSFEQALEKSLAALDSSHYPYSLLESMGLVLSAGRTPLRGLPLLVGCLAEDKKHKPRASVLVALESLLRGFLLLAEMGLEENCRPEKAAGRALEKKFSRAHLLLTADTLFTWPLELVAEKIDRTESPLVKEFSRLLGADGILRRLDSAGPDLEGLLTAAPVEALARAVLASGNYPAEAAAAAGWVYLREFESWFAVRLSQVSAEIKRIENRLAQRARDASCPRAVKQVAALIRFLK